MRTVHLPDHLCPFVCAFVCLSLFCLDLPNTEETESDLRRRRCKRSAQWMACICPPCTPHKPSFLTTNAPKVIDRVCLAANMWPHRHCPERGRFHTQHTGFGRASVRNGLRRRACTLVALPFVRNDPPDSRRTRFGIHFQQIDQHRRRCTWTDPSLCCRNLTPQGNSGLGVTHGRPTWLARDASGLACSRREEAR